MQVKQCSWKRNLRSKLGSLKGVLTVYLRGFQAKGKRNYRYKAVPEPTSKRD